MIYNLCLDLFNLNAGQILAVAIQFAITFAALFLKDKNLIAANMAQDFSRYSCPFYRGSADLYFSVIIHQKDFLEFYFLSFFTFKSMNNNLLVLLNLELLSCNIYNGVHFFDY